MSRPPGVPWISCSLRLTLTFALVVSTVGDAPVTVMFSARLATFIEKSTGVVWPTSTTMFSRVIGLEAGELQLDGVGAGHERREAVDAAGVGDAGHRSGDEHRAADRDGDAGHDARPARRRPAPECCRSEPARSRCAATASADQHREEH